MKSAVAFVTIGMFVFLSVCSAAEKFIANYDESKMPAYALPDPLKLNNGKAVTDVKTWQTKRRKELLELFSTQVYGKTPTKKLRTHYVVDSVDTNALSGKATRKEVSIIFEGNGLEQTMHLLLYVPNGHAKVPVFLSMNFGGNQTISSDPGITVSTNSIRPKTDPSRGSSASRWPVEKIIARGFGLATVYYGDVVPDDDKTGLQRGIHRLFEKNVSSQPKAEEWGAIGAWAWGLSRVLDYLVTDKDVNAKQVAVVGHSRLGKTAVWAGAQDERFALLISNDSGCGGAALSKRVFGETVGSINRAFPHWFCGNFKKYNEREDLLPVDQHELIALVAPRPVYIASASQDLWADPKGEFLSAKDAEPVYALFGKRGLGVEEMPAENHGVGDTIGYHVRTGKHDITDFDWERYLEFASRHFGMK